MTSELLKIATEYEGGSKRHKSSGSSSFNAEYGEASINLDTNASNNDEDEVQEIRRPMGRDKARSVAKKKRSRASGLSSRMTMHWLEKIERRKFWQRMTLIRCGKQDKRVLIKLCQRVFHRTGHEVMRKQNLSSV
ncbi:hypothetical protein Tco_1375735 [Tanacetum coccineum]